MNKLENIETHDFASFEEIFAVKNKRYLYVTSDIAVAMINHLNTSTIRVFATKRYLDDKEWKETYYNVIQQNWGGIHSDLGMFEDCMYVFGETDKSYVCAYLDQDVSDCEVCVVTKEHQDENVKDKIFKSLDEFIEAFKEQYFENIKQVLECNDAENCEGPKFVEMPKVSGWVKF